MEGNRREEIRKGPWKAEEDEVLVNHVKKYGPRDWSSIRSKGLLHRTGKSCRLRWVNKLRPNLKNGCKFSAEEERVVIDLQAQFGNKWAKIATFLPGRTDNDVKNFWSSRQKRLARILQTSAATPCSSSTNSKPQHKVKKDLPAAAFHDVPTFEGPMINSSMEEESSCKPQSRSSSHVENPETIRMAPLPGIVKTELPSCDENLVQDDSQFDFPFSPESLELSARLGDPSCIFSAFGEIGPFELGGGAPLSLGPPLFGSVTSCGHGARDVKNSGTPDTFFDDFPEDMFDQIEPLPSPSEW